MNQFSASSQDQSSVEIGPGGDLTVVWLHYGQGAYRDGIFGRRFLAGVGVWDSEFQVNARACGDAAAPRVTVDG